MFKNGKSYSMLLDSKLINFKVISYNAHSGIVAAHHKGTMIQLIININQIDEVELKSIREI